MMSVGAVYVQEAGLRLPYFEGCSIQNFVRCSASPAGFFLFIVLSLELRLLTRDTTQSFSISFGILINITIYG